MVAGPVVLKLFLQMAVTWGDLTRKIVCVRASEEMLRPSTT
jgi:hypothetical protein